MKKITFIFLFFSLLSYSQDKEVKDITSYPNSVISFNWSYNSFLGNLSPNMNVSPLSMGVDIYAMKTLLGKEQFVSMAMGGGLSVQNIKSNSFLTSADSSYFVEIPKELNYSKNKLSTVFLDIPIEIRLRVRPNPRDKAGIVRKRNFRCALGFKIGYNIQNYIKYAGEDYRNANYGNKIKFKEYNLKNILPYRYGLYTRVGIGSFSLYAYYALTTLFETGKGPLLRPFSIGLSITI